MRRVTENPYAFDIAATCPAPGSRLAIMNVAPRTESHAFRQPSTMIGCGLYGDRN